MSIRAIDLLAILIDRIKSCHPAPALFNMVETDDWPIDALSSLLSQRILAESNDAKAITCPGCELQCHKRVVVRRTETESRAFIVCDEEPRHGRVGVCLRNLRQFESGLRAMSLFVAAALNIGPPVASQNAAAYSLGVVKGRNGARTVTIGIEDGQLVIDVGKQRVPLGRCMSWTAAGVTLDAKVVQRLAARKFWKQSTSHSYTPDRSAQQERARETRERHHALFIEAKRRFASGDAKWTHIAEELAGTEFARDLKGPSVRRIISRMRASERKKPRSKPGNRK